MAVRPKDVSSRPHYLGQNDAVSEFDSTSLIFLLHVFHTDCLHRRLQSPLLPTALPLTAADLR